MNTIPKMKVGSIVDLRISKGPKIQAHIDIYTSFLIQILSDVFPIKTGKITNNIIKILAIFHTKLSPKMDVIFIGIELIMRPKMKDEDNINGMKSNIFFFFINWKGFHVYLSVCSISGKNNIDIEPNNAMRNSIK
jgi:hypothetical protein